MTVFLLLGGFFFFALLRYFEVTLTAYAAMQNPEVLQKLNLNERVIEPMLHNLGDRARHPGARDHDAKFCRRRSAPALTNFC